VQSPGKTGNIFMARERNYKLHPTVDFPLDGPHAWLQIITPEPLPEQKLR
jgi:hypothetical protein